MGFPGGSAVKTPPAVKEMQETWVWSLGVKDPLEKQMASHYSILAWRIPWTGEPGRLQSMGLQRVRHDRATKHTSIDSFFLFTIYIYLLGCVGSWLWQAGSWLRPAGSLLVLSLQNTWLSSGLSYSMACGFLVSWPGHLHLKVDF